jgi:hypothetical protein
MIALFSQSTRVCKSPQISGLNEASHFWNRMCPKLSSSGSIVTYRKDLRNATAAVQNVVSIALIFFGLALRNYFKIK